jgi:hypothetical protein
MTRTEFLNTYELDELMEEPDDPLDNDDIDDFDIRELYYPETLP